MKFHRLVMILFRSIVTVAALALTAVSAIYTYRQIGELRAERTAKAQTAQVLRQYSAPIDSTQTFTSETLHGQVVTKLKYDLREGLLYQFRFDCKADMELVAADHFTLNFLDAEGFLVHRETIDELAHTFSRDKNGELRWTAVTSLGSLSLDLGSYGRISRVSVGSSASVRTIHPSNSKTSTSHNRRATTRKQSQFDKEMTEWRKKAESILIGMTYQEMVNAAGYPRATAGIESNLLWKYDTLKYNYGPIWVYFKDELVARLVDVGR